MTPVPSGGFVAGLPEAVPVNRDLPVAYEGTYRDGGDGTALSVEGDLDHVALVVGDDEVEGKLGIDGGGNRVQVVTLRRNAAYGATLLDSIEDVPGAKLLGPRGFFFGDHAGDAISKFGEVYRDKGAAVDGLIRTREIAPAGAGGECFYRNVWLTVLAETVGEFTVTPVVDGERVTAAAETFEVQNTEKPEQFEIPLTVPYSEGGVEQLRRGLRGVWFRVEVTAEDILGTGGRLSIESAELEYEVVQERHPGLSFTEEPETAAGLSTPRPFYFGESEGNRLGEFGVGRDDLGTAVETFIRPNHVAPAGMMGECVFRNVYLAFQRNNPSDLDLELTPIVGGERGPTRTITLSAVAAPVTDLYEVPITEPYPDGADEELRFSPRGAEFTFELSTVGDIPAGDVFLLGAELEYDVVRESQEAESG